MDRYLLVVIPIATVEGRAERRFDSAVRRGIRLAHQSRAFGGSLNDEEGTVARDRRPANQGMEDAPDRNDEDLIGERDDENMIGRSDEDDFEDDEDLDDDDMEDEDSVSEE
jgi:hypothetical protein